MFRIRKPSSSPKKTSSSSSKSAAASSAAVSNKRLGAPGAGLEEQIRARAYQLFLERGGQGGSPEQDWLRAEAEVRDGTGG